MAKNSPLQFKGTTLKIIQAQLRTTDLAELHEALAELTGNAPDFFDNDLAVLDFSAADDLPGRSDWSGLRQLLARSGLHAVATCGLPDIHARNAAAAGLPAIAAAAFSRPARSRPTTTDETPAAAAPVATSAVAPASPPRHEPTPAAAPAVSAPPVSPPVSLPPEPRSRMIVLEKPLRSGQRFYARGCDLVVTAMVSAGAEVIADGNIHIYAPLRGRALAGASGDKTARIFTTCMEAELVSVAGLYRTFEAGMPPELARQPATIALQGDGEQSRLHVAPLSLR